MSKSYIAGVGMTPFVKPGQNESFDAMAEAAIRAAVQDAGIDFRLIEEATAGWAMGDSCCGQEALYRVGMTGIPVQNVENACASGSTAVYLARRAVESGEADVALAFGVEQMPAGAPPSSFNDRPMYSKLIEATRRIQGWDDKVPIPFQIFGGAALELQQKYGMTPEVFAMITVKSRRHAAHNKNAIFRDPLTVEEVLASKPVFGPLTPLPVLATHMRRGCGRRRIRALQAPRRALAGRPDRRPGTGHRHRIELRIKQHDQGVGLRCLTSRGRHRLRTCRLGTRGRRCGGVARLLLVQ